MLHEPFWNPYKITKAYVINTLLLFKIYIDPKFIKKSPQLPTRQDTLFGVF